MRQALHCLCGFPAAKAETRRHAVFNDLRLDWLRSPLKCPSAQNKRRIVLETKKETDRERERGVYGEKVQILYSPPTFQVR